MAGTTAKIGVACSCGAVNLISAKAETAEWECGNCGASNVTAVVKAK